MEDTAKALEMAGAMLIFVIAISIAFLALGQAKSTSDAVFLATDKTGYYEYIPGETPVADDVTRVVGIETVIPKMYDAVASDLMRLVIIDQNNKIALVLDKNIDIAIPKIVPKDRITIKGGGSWRVNQLDGDSQKGLNTIRLDEAKIIGKIIGEPSLTEEELLRRYVATYANASVGDARALWRDWGSADKSAFDRLKLIINAETGTINNSKFKYPDMQFLGREKNTQFEERMYIYYTSGEAYVPNLAEGMKSDESLELVELVEKPVVIYKIIN